jgi:hypothetical protein
VALVCGPFYLFSLGMQRNGMWHESFSPEFVGRAVGFYSVALVRAAGAGVAALALVGLGRRVVLPLARREPAQPTWAALGALLVSVWLFHVLVPCSLEPRHLIVAIPSLVVFAADGLYCLWGRLGELPRPGARQLARGLLGAAVLLAVLAEFRPYRKEWHGFGEVARRLDEVEEWRDSVVMVSSDATGEGIMVTEVALRDHRPGRFVLRASKLFSQARWHGAEYRCLCDSPEKILGRLKKVPVGIIVLDNSIPADELREHHRRLADAVRAFPDDWRLVGRYPLTRRGHTHPEALEVYALYGHQYMPRGEIAVDLSMMLGRTIREPGKERRK